MVPRPTRPLRILVSRTDRLGDVVLTLPLCGLLKARGHRVIFLGRAYTRPALEACDAVDEILEWDDARSRADARALVAGARADAVLHVKPHAGVAWAAFQARVPLRVGTSRRAFHWLLCNRLESIARRDSPLHEAQLNVRLARALLDDEALAFGPERLAQYGRLRPRVPVPDALRPLVARDRFALVIHPRSGGSAAEWPLGHWAALARALPPDRFRLLVTGSRAEGDALRPWLDAQPPHVHDLTGRTDGRELLALLAAADGFVAASTGPLHAAAALGTRTLGLFSPRRPIHPGRWAPIGARAEVLVGDGQASSAEDLAAIAPERVAARVLAWAG
jgi:ADP-heptose:LPS heptosyltransferase